MFRLLRFVFALSCIAWCAAAVAMLLHNLETNPQIDSQLVAFAFGFAHDVQTGHITDAFLTMRKYPLLPVATEAMLFAVTSGLLMIGGFVHGAVGLQATIFLHPTAFHFTARLLCLVATVSTFLLLQRASRKLFPDVSPWLAVLALLPSILLLTFATSVRPHPLVMAMTMLTLVASLPLVTAKGWRRELPAFVTAGLAFATLQSGLLAFAFPVWAFLCDGGRVRWHNLLRLRLWGLIAAALLLGFVLGYTHALGFLVGRPVEYGLGLGNTDMNDQPWTGGGFRSLGILLVGGEPLLLIAVLWSVGLMISRKSKVHPMVYGLLLYVLGYVLLFGLNANTPPRFFLPILPVLALLAVPAIASSRPLAILMGVLGCIVGLRFLWIAAEPDTYQIARSFIESRTQGAIVSQVPWYFLGIPPQRASIGAPSGERERYIQGLDHDLPDARPYVPQEAWSDASVFIAHTAPTLLSPWYVCATIPGAAPHTDSGFLWGEVDWSLSALLTAPRLGPPLWVACYRTEAVKPLR